MYVGTYTLQRGAGFNIYIFFLIKRPAPADKCHEDDDDDDLYTAGHIIIVPIYILWIIIIYVHRSRRILTAPEIYCFVINGFGLGVDNSFTAAHTLHVVLLCARRHDLRLNA